MITYKTIIEVLVDGKKTGEIRETDGGFHYVPNGGLKYAGETFRTLGEVKRSLES